MNQAADNRTSGTDRRVTPRADLGLSAGSEPEPGITGESGITNKFGTTGEPGSVDKSTETSAQEAFMLSAPVDAPASELGTHDVVEPHIDEAHEPCADHPTPFELRSWEKAILDLEKHWRKWGLSHDEAVRAKLGLDSRTYFILLSQLLDDPRFWKADPPLVDRLRRMRDRRKY